MKLNGNIYRVGSEKQYDLQSTSIVQKIDDLKAKIEPWLSAVFQSEYLSLLVGSGLTNAVAHYAGVEAVGMQPEFDRAIGDYGCKLEIAATKVAEEVGRKTPNIEDQIRVTSALIEGLEISRDDGCEKVQKSLETLLNDILAKLSQTERSIYEKIIKPNENDSNQSEGERSEGGVRSSDSAQNVAARMDENANDPVMLLVSFLMSFASRTATRERLNIFTTNYDRFIEFGADLAGIHLLDRFVGGLVTFSPKTRPA